MLVLRIGRQLEAVASSSAWCLGDWLSYGRAAYAGRYRDAVEQTSLDYQTLRNYAWVAGRFPLSRRRDTLSFGHHAEVAALPEPEQDFWLRKAGDLGWSRNHLRCEVRASLRERRAGPAITGPRQLPIEGEPADVAQIVGSYAKWLAASTVPKLFIHADPGTISDDERSFCRSWPSQAEVTVRGLHFIQEDSPDEIGQAIASWSNSLSP